MTTDLQKRALLFWVGCIGTRVGLAWLAKNRPGMLPYIGIAALLISIGFTTIFLGGLRKTGPETFGRPIWWDSMRPIHATLYGLVAYNAFNGHGDMASAILGIDVVIGVAAWTYNRI